MFNNVALDVSIGIIFIILLYSLLATVMQEMIGKWTQMRSKMLRKAIYRMIQDENIKRGFPKLEDTTFIKAFYDYPLIRYLAESDSKQPAYLSSSNFSETIIHLLAGQSNSNVVNKMSLIHDNLGNNSFAGFTIGSQTRTYLQKLHADSDQDIYKFAQKLQTWFDDTMQRTTGWYKRRTQKMLFLIGLAIAVLFNVDLIAITKILAHDDKARGEIVKMAIAGQAEYGRYVDSVGKSSKITKITRKNPVDSTIIEETLYTPMDDSMLNRAYRMVSNDVNKIQDILGLGWIWPFKDSAAVRKIDYTIRALSNTNAFTPQVIKQLSDDYSKARTGDSAGIKKADSTVKALCQQNALTQEAIKKLNDDYKKAGTTDSIGVRKMDSTICALSGISTRTRQIIKKLDDERKEASKTSSIPYIKQWENGDRFLFIIGWLLTALAVSLGAPFWYDMLNKIMLLRGTGVKPVGSTDNNTGQSAKPNVKPVNPIG